MTTGGMPRTFAHGDHVCGLFESEEEQLTIAVRYIASGLESGDRCLYAAGSAEALRRFESELARSGVDVEEAIQAGALLQRTTADTHLAGGRFDCDRMLRYLNDAVEAALTGGFNGLRACGDMSWLLDQPEGADQVAEYEAMLNHVLDGVRAAGMCMYDRTRLPHAIIDQALATHRSVSVNGQHVNNGFYEVDGTAARRTIAGTLQTGHSERRPTRA